MQNRDEPEKPSRATAVSSTLATVTPRVVNRRISRSESRLEQMVPPAMIMEIRPAEESGRPNVRRMVGQAEPSSESGRPRLMKIR